MHLMKNFIMRIEMKSGAYSSDFKKLNDKDVIDALFPLPLDALDTLEERARKIFLLRHTAEANQLVVNLKVDPALIFALNGKIKIRNVGVHLFDNKKFRDSTYVGEQLTALIEVVDKLGVGNDLEPNKEEIKILLNNTFDLHASALSALALLPPV
jgi:hypothetical protein